MDNRAKKEFYDLFVRLEELYSEIEFTLRTNATSSDYERAKAYWLGNLSVAISGSEYFTHNPTFETFLQDNEIIDEDGKFIDDDCC